MTFIVPIRSVSGFKRRRIFNVEVDEDGRILRYETQNIQGAISVSDEEVKLQIDEFLRKIRKVS